MLCINTKQLACETFLLHIPQVRKKDKQTKEYSLLALDLSLSAQSFLCI